LTSSHNNSKLKQHGGPNRDDTTTNRWITEATWTKDREKETDHPAAATDACLITDRVSQKYCLTPFSLDCQLVLEGGRPSLRYAEDNTSGAFLP